MDYFGFDTFDEYLQFLSEDLEIPYDEVEGVARMLQMDGGIDDLVEFLINMKKDFWIEGLTLSRERI